VDLARRRFRFHPAGDMRHLIDFLTAAVPAASPAGVIFKSNPKRASIFSTCLSEEFRAPTITVREIRCGLPHGRGARELYRFHLKSRRATYLYIPLLVKHRGLPFGKHRKIVHRASSRTPLACAERIRPSPWLSTKFPDLRCYTRNCLLKQLQKSGVAGPPQPPILAIY
jgi:hypothetical protein